MLSHRTSRPRSSSYERSGSEGLVDLHVYVIPVEQWKNHLTSVLNQLITDSFSAGYIRVHPESVLSDLRHQITRQLGFESVPPDYIFLRCLGRSFTQVKRKQEQELKTKYFMPPHTYSPELYVLDSSAAQRFPSSSQSSNQRSFSGDYSTRAAALPPPAYPVATRPYAPRDSSYNDREQADEQHSRQKHREEDDLRNKQRLQELEEEEKRRRRRREEEEEDERTRRIIEELEVMRREELEAKRKSNEEEDIQRMRKLEEEEEEDRLRLRRLVEEEGRRGIGVHPMESPIEEFARPKTPSPTPRQRTFEKHEPRDVWKKRFLEEKKRTPPREEKTKALKEELDNVNRKILDHLATLREGVHSLPPVHGTPKPSVDKDYGAKYEATRMEHEIDDLQNKLQSTKLQLTAEMKLRNQTEKELLELKAELAHLKANYQPRVEEKIITKIVEVPVYHKEPEEEAPPPPIAPSGILEEAFKVFASKSSGGEATGQDIFKWVADAGIIGKTLNNHHIDITFHKVKPKGMKTITVKELYPLIDELAVKYRDDTKLSYQGARRRLIDRMANAPFKLHGATITARNNGVARLANGPRTYGPSSQKAARGRGREIVVESSGYGQKY